MRMCVLQAVWIIQEIFRGIVSVILALILPILRSLLVLILVNLKIAKNVQGILGYAQPVMILFIRL